MNGWEKEQRGYFNVFVYLDGQITAFENNFNPNPLTQKNLFQAETR